MKIFLSLILACLLVSTGHGVVAERKKPCPLRTKVFQVPPGFLGPYPELKPGEIVPRSDAKGYLKAAGIEIPDGGDAYYEVSRGRLTIRATDDVINQVTVLVEGDLGLPRQIRVFLGVAEFTLPSDQSLAGLTYERARALAGDSWRVLERSSVLTKPGQLTRCFYPGAPASIAKKANSGSPPAASAIPSEQLDVECGMSKDETTVELEFRFDHGSAGEPAPKRFDVMEKVALRNAEPTLVRATALPAAKGAQATTVRALIVRATIVDPSGVRPPPVPEKPLPHHQ